MDLPNLTAAQLIERARRGERAAQDDLWRAHRRWVAAIVLAHRPREADTDDLMQDVALKMIDKLQTLRDVSAFRPWLRRIVINTCRGAARSMKPTLKLAGTDDEGRDGKLDGRNHIAPPPQSREIDSAESAEVRDLAERLLERVLGLPSEYREPLLLRCVQSLSYNQISDILELPLTTIETRLARARRMLRQEMGEDAGEELCAKKTTPSGS